MTIQLKPEQERIIQEQIRNGRFRNAEEVLDHALAALRDEDSKSDSESVGPQMNLAQFLMESPLAGSGLEIERNKEPLRDIEL